MAQHPWGNGNNLNIILYSKWLTDAEAASVLFQTLSGSSFANQAPILSSEYNNFIHLLKSDVYSPHTIPYRVLYFLSILTASVLVKRTTISCLDHGKFQPISIHSPRGWPSSPTFCTWLGLTHLSFKTFFGEAHLQSGVGPPVSGSFDTRYFSNTCHTDLELLVQFNKSLFLDHRLLEDNTVFVLFSPILQVQCLTQKKYTINICLINTDDYFFT